MLVLLLFLAVLFLAAILPTNSRDSDYDFRDEYLRTRQMNLPPDLPEGSHFHPYYRPSQFPFDPMRWYEAESRRQRATVHSILYIIVFALLGIVSAYLLGKYNVL